MINNFSLKKIYHLKWTFSAICKLINIKVWLNLIKCKKIIIFNQKKNEMKKDAQYEKEFFNQQANAIKFIKI